MYGVLILMTMSLLGMIALGLYYEFRPMRNEQAPKRLKMAVAANLLLFVGAQVALLILGMQDVMASPEAAAAAPKEISVGMGLALIGIGLPTAVATLAAAIAVGPIGAASLAVVAEKPEAFGRSLVYLGLAEGIAIYGLVVTILMLGRI